MNEGLGGHDEASVPRAGQLEQGQQPLRNDVRVRGEQVIGQDLPIRKGQQRQSLTRKEAQLRGEPLELPRGVRDDHIEALVGSSRLGERQRRGAPVKLVPADPSGGRSGDRGA